MTGCQSKGSGALGRVGALLLATSIVFAAAACGAPPEARHVTASEPVSGGTLRLIQEVPAGLDPIHSESVYESLPINQIFDTLVATDESLNVVPSLAEAWHISRDGLTYDFNLRKGVRFHDGHELDAGDVVLTFHRVLVEGGTDSLAYPTLKQIAGAEELATGKTDGLTGLERVDDHTVRFTLDDRNPLFLEMLAMDNVAIVPEHVLAAVGSEAFARAPVGTGPFVFDGWDDARLTLQRNDDYFRGRAHLESVQLNFYDADDNDYGYARFKRGELDALEPTTKTYEKLVKCEGVQLFRFQELSLSFLGFNSSRAPLDRPWLRRAIAHAVDRDRMVHASPSVRVHAPGILPPGIAGHTPESKRLEFSPDTAKQILADAGHPNGQGLPPIRLYDPSKGGEPDAVVRQLVDDLARIGLRLEVVQVSWAEMSDRLDSGDYEAFVLAWIADMSDPDAFLSGFGEGGSGDFFRFEDKRAVDMLAEAAREFEPGRRGKMFRDAEHYILQQAPFVPLYHTRGLLATQPAVRGMRPGPFGVAKVELEQVWLQPDEGES